ncbi:MAG: hypothetical protein ACQETE_07795 [Bacteroidota bacterium]
MRQRAVIVGFCHDSPDFRFRLHTLRPLIKWREEFGEVKREEKIRTAEKLGASEVGEGASDLFSGT